MQAATKKGVAWFLSSTPLHMGRQSCPVALQEERHSPRVGACPGLEKLAHDDTLEDRHEVLDVDEGVLAAVYLEGLQGFHDKLPEVFPPLLAVVDAVSEVIFVIFKRRESERITDDADDGVLVCFHGELCLHSSKSYNKRLGHIERSYMCTPLPNALYSSYIVATTSERHYWCTRHLCANLEQPSEKLP